MDSTRVRCSGTSSSRCRRCSLRRIRSMMSLCTGNRVHGLCIFLCWFPIVREGRHSMGSGCSMMRIEGVVRERVCKRVVMVVALRNQIVAVHLVTIVHLSHSRRVLGHRSDWERESRAHITKARYTAHVARTTVLPQSGSAVAKPDLFGGDRKWTNER